MSNVLHMVETYLDDMIVKSKNDQDHVANLSEVFEHQEGDSEANWNDHYPLVICIEGRK